MSTHYYFSIKANRLYSVYIFYSKINIVMNNKPQILFNTINVKASKRY